MQDKRRMLMCYIAYNICLFSIIGICLLEKTVNGSEWEETIETMQMKKKEIALTFDDGPSVYTEELLDGLKERNVKVTFFVIGQSVEKMPEIVKREDKEGHLIGNHTYHHVEITKLSDEKAREEIEKTNKLLKRLIHKDIWYIRPPFGLWQKHLEEEMNVLPVMWSIDPLDWTTKNVDEIVNKVVTHAEENDIILLHDCYKSSVQAAFRIIDTLHERGFEFVTVDTLLLD